MLTTSYNRENIYEKAAIFILVSLLVGLIESNYQSKEKLSKSRPWFVWLIQGFISWNTCYDLRQNLIIVPSSMPWIWRFGNVILMCYINFETLTGLGGGGWRNRRRYSLRYFPVNFLSPSTVFPFQSASRAWFTTFQSKASYPGTQVCRLYFSFLTALHISHSVWALLNKER